MEFWNEGKVFENSKTTLKMSVVFFFFFHQKRLMKTHLISGGLQHCLCGLGVSITSNKT